MGNTRHFRAGRAAKRDSMRAKIKKLSAQVGYLEGLSMALAAEKEAAHMERPPDLEEWVESVTGELSEEELAELDGMSPEQREQFIDQLGRRINTSLALLADTDSNVPERVDALRQDAE